MDFVNFNFDIKTETYILITNEKYKYERTASKWFLQHSVPYNGLFNCFHYSVENPTGSKGGQVHLSGLLQIGKKEKSPLQTPNSLRKKTEKEQEHKKISQAEKSSRTMQQVSPLHFQRVSKSSYLPT